MCIMCPLPWQHVGTCAHSTTVWRLHAPLAGVCVIMKVLCAQVSGLLRDAVDGATAAFSFVWSVWLVCASFHVVLKRVPA